MTTKQIKLITEAATVEVDGEGFRARMNAWLDEKDKLEPTQFEVGGSE